MTATTRPPMTCYHCGKPFPDWPGARRICPACFAKRPEHINRRVRWHPQEAPLDLAEAQAPLDLAEVRTLFDMAEADRTRHPRKVRTTLAHRGEQLAVDGTMFGLRLWRGDRLIARRWL